MAAHIHKQYMRLLAKWPVDSAKSYERNLKHHLENQVNKLHNPRISANPLESDEPLSGKNIHHEANMRALQEIIDNKHKNTWPIDRYKTGMFGLTPAQLNKVNSESYRVRLGLGATRWTYFKAWLKKDPS